MPVMLTARGRHRRVLIVLAAPPFQPQPSSALYIDRAGFSLCRPLFILEDTGFCLDRARRWGRGLGRASLGKLFEPLYCAWLEREHTYASAEEMTGPRPRLLITSE